MKFVLFESLVAAGAIAAGVEDESVVGKRAELDVDLDAVHRVVGGEHGHERVAARTSGEAGNLDAVGEPIALSIIALSVASGFVNMVRDFVI